MPDADGHPECDEMELGAVLSALADPLRRQVVADLIRCPHGHERTCVSFQLPVSKASLTHHFRVLREAGLIRTLRRADLDRRFPGLLALVQAERA
jgi:DNA-binding transcriptional ArsR family regulator